MMKNYHIYVFQQEHCAPCTRLKEHVKTLTEAEQAELDFVPLKTAYGDRTALAEELSVELSPTLVVTHETVACEVDTDDEEYCELEEESVEKTFALTRPDLSPRETRVLWFLVDWISLYRRFAPSPHANRAGIRLTV